MAEPVCSSPSPLGDSKAGATPEEEKAAETPTSPAETREKMETADQLAAETVALATTKELARLSEEMFKKKIAAHTAAIVRLGGDAPVPPAKAKAKRAAPSSAAGSGGPAPKKKPKPTDPSDLHHASEVLLSWISTSRFKKEMVLINFFKSKDFVDDTSSDRAALLATLAQITTAITGLHADTNQQLILAQSVYSPMVKERFDTAEAFLETWLKKLRELQELRRSQVQAQEQEQASQVPISFGPTRVVKVQVA